MSSGAVFYEQDFGNSRLHRLELMSRRPAKADLRRPDCWLSTFLPPEQGRNHHKFGQEDSPLLLALPRPSLHAYNGYFVNLAQQESVLAAVQGVVTFGNTSNQSRGVRCRPEMPEFRAASGWPEFHHPKS